ncbi:GNAT family N-acetyltransferase [Vaginisenegalia massiliensis]|uniref:GNAT family N-acetyltransferase n=1 Tax=Vaginisenegalia massiliensis TaxID=2058294 RepID=UPI000F526E2F|nr:GNAT family N-acetyltransferase [Vaginisenegalia massiliensis]
MQFKWIDGHQSSDFQEALTIRQRVFIEEQGFSYEEEMDELDPLCWHLIGYLNGQAVATARIYFLNSTHLKLQRIAVLPDFRGQQLGQKLLAEIDHWASQRGVQQLHLGAQDQAIGFYEQAGYSVSDPVGYLEGHVPHHDMVKNLK